MPELPEVETIRTQLTTKILGNSLLKVEVFRSDKIIGNLNLMVGSSLILVRRYSKLLVLDFSNQYSLLIHLKMTGRLLLFTKRSMLSESHSTVSFTFNEDKAERILIFSDVRRFGYIHMIETPRLNDEPYIHSLGKEPLKDLTLSLFVQKLSQSNRPIKTFLLDQTKIAGIGNIYACESLWIAKIHPRTATSSLSLTKSQGLFKAIEEVLKEAISRGGASDNDYVDLMGKKGNYQNFFKVYHRFGKACLRCGATIAYEKLAGRGTFYCPVCQKKSEKA